MTESSYQPVEAQPAPPPADAAPAGSSPGSTRFLVAGLVVALLAGLTWLAIARDSDDTAARASVSARGAVTSLTLSYPDGWVTQDLKKVEGKAGLLAAAAHSKTGTTFLARTVVGRLSKDVRLEDLAEQTVTAMAGAIEGFKLVDRDVREIAGAEAISLVYTQASGKTVFTTRMLVLPMDRQTLYLTARAAGKGLQEVQGDLDDLVAQAVRKVAAGPS